MENHLQDTDRTGCQIVHLSRRPDVQALRTVNALCRVSDGWRKLGDVFVFLMFMLQLYWTWPMTCLWTLLSGLHPNDVTESLLRDKLKRVLALYKGLKVLNGSLVKSKWSGLSPLKSPSERRSGVRRYLKLSKEVLAWRNCAKHLAYYFQRSSKIELRRALEILGNGKLRTFDHKPTYTNVRAIRALVAATENPLADTADWSIWRSMSRHVRDAIKSSGLWDYEDAVKFRDAMVATLKKNY